MLIDTHCHLNFDNYQDDLKTVIGNAKKAGVKKFIVPGVDHISNLKAVELTEKFPEVIYASVGVHPYEAGRIQSVNPLEKLITDDRKSGKPERIIAIGECGLDYHQFGHEPALGKKEQQKYLLVKQLRLGLKYNLPVIMHCREAFADLYNILDSLPSIPHGVIHCFSGGLQDVRMARDRNLYIGIDGNITYAKNLQMIMPDIPLEMLLLETDSPNLTPVPFRGKRNEPKYLTYSAKFIAGLRNTTSVDIASVTSQNATTLFHLSG